MLHNILESIINIAILLFEFTGVIIIILSGIKGIYEYITKSPYTGLNLAKAMALGLEFKLGSEILRTVIIREFSEILIVGAIIALRAAITFLIHWEIKNAQKKEPPETDGQR